MKSYEMQIAEAVRDACIASGDFSCRIAERIDLAAIIASVPKPEPVATAWMCHEKMENAFARPPRNEQEWLEHDSDGYWSTKGYYEKPLYTSPPAVEINAELFNQLKGLVSDVFGLIDESDGVAGMHQNGDIAEWDELLPEGRFERLTHLYLAQDAIAKAEGE